MPKQVSKSGAARSSKKMPPTPRGSLRCFRKKYSSHQSLKRRWTSSPKGASASRHVRWKWTRVLLEPVVRREIHSAAEPPDGGLVLLRGDEAADIHVHRRHVRVTRVEHERHAHRLEPAAGELGARHGRRRREPVARHVREVDAAALEERTLLDDARIAAAAFRTCPRITAEPAAVGRLERRDDSVLQAGEIVLDCGDVHAPHLTTAIGLSSCVRRWRGSRCGPQWPGVQCRAGTACRRTGSRRPLRRRASAPSSRCRRAR